MKKRNKTPQSATLSSHQRLQNHQDIADVHEWLLNESGKLDPRLASSLNTTLKAAGERRKTKSYIGDGVYVELEQGELVLTTENGISVTNRIVLDDPTLKQLLTWLQAHTKLRFTVEP